MELADTSVWARKSHPFLRDWFTSAIEAGEIAGCDMVALESVQVRHASRIRPAVGLADQEECRVRASLVVGAGLKRDHIPL